MTDLAGYLRHAKSSPHRKSLAAIRTGGTGRPVQHERAEQEALWARIQHEPWSAHFAHWPNERPNRREAWRMALSGVRPGLPDNWLLLPRGGYAGAVSELKRRNAPPSAVRPEQRAWLEQLEVCGFLVGVHRGWEEAFEFFAGYVAAVEPGEAAE